MKKSNFFKYFFIPFLITTYKFRHPPKSPNSRQKSAGSSNYRGTSCPERSRMGFFPLWKFVLEFYYIMNHYLDINLSSRTINLEFIRTTCSLEFTPNWCSLAFLLGEASSTHIEKFRQIDPISKNKPKVKFGEFDISCSMTSKYEKSAERLTSGNWENKANSNPIQRQLGNSELPIYRLGKDSTKYWVELNRIFLPTLPGVFYVWRLSPGLAEH